MRRAVVLLLALSLGGCDAVADFKTKSTAETTIREAMRDPSSTQFRSESVHHVDGRSFVCGEVNTANGYGGKIGFRRFYSGGDQNHIDPAEVGADAKHPPSDVRTISDAALETLRQSSLFEMGWSVACGGAPHPLRAY